MSYRIVYDGREGKYEVRQQKPLSGMIFVIFACVLLFLCLSPSTAEQLRSMLIPGEESVTVEAFSAMTDDLRSGAGILEAVEGFCRQVIHGQ